MKQYRLVAGRETEQLQTELDELADDGWQLFAATTTGDTAVLIMERERLTTQGAR